MVLVMDAGKAGEYDTPKALVAKGGHFKNLIDALGETEASSLLAQIQ